MERIDDMTEETKQKIQKIAQTYGYDAQSRQCIEEMAELTQAINKFWRKQLKCGEVEFSKSIPLSPEHMSLKEEITDVYIMLHQMMFLLGIKSIEKIVKEKLDRQLERIETE